MRFDKRKEFKRTSILCEFVFALSNSLNGVDFRSATLAYIVTISTRWIKDICKIKKKKKKTRKLISKALGLSFYLQKLTK